MIKFLQDIWRYCHNLDNYVWVDPNNRVVFPLETTWFWGFYIYPLVTYYYLDEIDKYDQKASNLYCMNRFEFVSNMHVHNIK